MAANDLIQKRGRILCALTKFNTFAAAIDADITLEDIEVRSNKLEDYFREFTAIENKLLMIPDQMSKYDEFETKYFHVKAIFIREIRQRQIRIEAPQPANTDLLNKTIDNLCAQQLRFFEGLRENTLTQTNQDVKLPRVIIEPFAGNYSQWPSFKDLYNSSVHLNDALSDSHKFQLLKGFLKGEAADLIRYIPITDLNYREAWDKLQARYDKKKAVVNSLVDKFMKQKPMQQFQSELKCLDSQNEKRDPWLIYLIMNKLDDQTKEAWAKFSVDMESPSFEEFLRFLDKRCDTFESCLPSKVSVNKSSSISKIPTRLNFHTTSERLKCPCCDKNNHPLYKCFKYKKLSVPNRIKMAKDLQVCLNCLTPSHSVSECSSSISCRICGQRHRVIAS